MSGGLLDAIFAELANAVQDVRREVVERGWFGRPTTPAMPVDHETPRGTSIMENFEARRPTFEDLWGPRSEHEATPAPEKDRGIDF